MLPALIQLLIVSVVPQHIYYLLFGILEKKLRFEIVVLHRPEIGHCVTAAKLDSSAIVSARRFLFRVERP
jgi:hypothetical protein